MRPRHVGLLTRPDVAVVVDLLVDLDDVGAIDWSLEVSMEEEGLVCRVVEPSGTDSAGQGREFGIVGIEVDVGRLSGELVGGVDAGVD